MQLIKRPENYNYKELCTPAGEHFNYPETCPCCGAMGSEKKDFYHKFVYERGGEWKWKSQIQNHTNIVYGSCGLEEKYAEQDRLAMLIIIYNSFCNWSMFPKELKIGGEPTIKDHVIYKISFQGQQRLSHPKDWVDKFTKWVEENFDKYKPVIDNCLGKDNHGRYVDPRLICGFDEDLNPIYVTDWEEIATRLNEIGFNEYGNLQFYKSWNKTLTKWWETAAV